MTNNDQYIVSYVEYSLYNQNGNLIKSVKQGKILITPEDNAAYNPKDYNILEKDYQTDNISSEEINEYKIQPLKNIINEIQKPVQKRPRPIMPIMDAQNT
ncbi:MAG TPA: hypothetical protein GX745_02615 [Clostridiales bacterium]|nr:hypothetical protein [Clostridiales bacterium]